jgi:hypothetical protein
MASRANSGLRFGLTHAPSIEHEMTQRQEALRGLLPLVGYASVTQRGAEGP